ncbi:MAG: F0F1 ATP synthase subunit delta [Actinomycetota bacterium]|nr:F0F1 ATP synthase subunit delta [Actinomycetota bacterium]
MQDLADVYARSLFAVAKEHEVLDEIREQLGQFADGLAENRDLQVFFFSPYFTPEEKQDGLEKVLEGADEHFARFLALLAENHRLPVLFRIRRAFDDLWAEENRQLSVSVTSAVELDEDTTEEIERRVEEETGRNVVLSTEVDPDLLGGLVLRVGNVIMDASVRTRLERIRRDVARAA